MNTKGSSFPFLLEIAIALLVFGLCAGVCLSVFSTAQQRNNRAADLMKASNTAQCAAEYLRAGDERGFEEYFAAQDIPDGWTSDKDSLTVTRTCDGNVIYYRIIIPELIDITVARAEVSVP